MDKVNGEGDRKKIYFRRRPGANRLRAAGTSGKGTHFKKQHPYFLGAARLLWGELLVTFTI